MMRAAVCTFLLWVALPTFAHEVRPAYLEMRESSVGEFRVLWKTPMVGDLRLSLRPVFSGATANLTEISSRRADSSAVQTWRLQAVDALRGQTLQIEGLAGTMTDALVRIEFADGTGWTQRLTPGSPSAVIPERESAPAVAGVYLGLGVEHILLGIDHLLFVLALLLVTRGRWNLVKTVTAFTVAHSITLGLATLGIVNVPGPPVEAVIALSIAFVAAEILRARRGHSGIATRSPWVVAFTFGLLHGFGFAGALTEVGLPQGQVPIALLFFNLGVEAGQLVFIAAVLGLGIVVTRFQRRLRPAWATLAVPYAIGTVAMFWVIQRIAAF